MHSFSSIIEQLSTVSSQYKVTIADNWLQGRAIYGGLIASIGAKAMSLHVTEDRHIRSLMTSFIAPSTPGQVSIEVTSLRQGKSVHQLLATLKQNSQVVAVCSAAFAALRKTEKAEATKAIIEKTHGNLKPLPHVNHVTPEFLRNFEVRWIDGCIPFTGKKDHHLKQWVRLVEPAPRHMPEQMIAAADVPPPLMLSHYQVPTTASTLTWTLDFAAPPKQICTDWFYLDFRLNTAANGYCQQQGKIYSEDGSLLMISNQCMTYFEPKNS